MALYQPSNIIPSSFAGPGGGVVDVNDNVLISWQVNGSSPLLQEIIYIYENNAASTLVHTFTSSVHNGFFGTDARGNIQRYVFEPGVTWASVGLTNGNSYKLKIRQRYPAGESTAYVDQTSTSVFITRTAPTLSITPAAGTLTSVQQTFAAPYSQAQDDEIEWVRWVLSDGNGNVLDDTGVIYTSLRSYTYNGFFTGETYSLSCTIETESGVEKTATNVYTVSYDSAAASGGIATECNPDDSVTLSWAAGVDIPGTASAQDYGSIVDGVLHLSASRSITWNQVNGNSMSFASPYAFAWRGEIGAQTTSSQTINSGTWEKYKETTGTDVTDVTRSITTSQLTKPYTGNDTHQFSISANSYSVDTETASVSATGSWDGSSYNASRTYSSDFVIDSLPSTYWSSNSTVVDTFMFTDDTHKSVRVLMSGPSSNLNVSFNVSLRKYTGTASYTPAQSGVSNPIVLSTTGTSAAASMSGNNIQAMVYATASGTYTVNVSYAYSYIGNDSYSGSMSYSLSTSTGTLTSVGIVSTTGTGGASARIVQGNQYSVTIYNNASASCSAVVRLVYTYTTDGSDAYRTIITGTLAGAISGTVTSTTAAGGATVTVNRGSYTVTMYHSSATSRTATVSFTIESTAAHNSLLSLNSGALLLKNTATQLQLTESGTTKGYITIPAYTHTCLATVTPTQLKATFYDAGGATISTASTNVSITEPTVTSVVITGAQNCDYVYITANTSANTASPGWNGSTLLWASFTENLQAGTLASSDSLSVAIYRREGTTLTPLGVYGSNVSTIRDYGIRSKGEYEYILYYIADGAYSVGMTSDEICKQFRQFTLIEATQDTDDQSVYHPVSVWRFRNNIEAGAVSNGNNPAMLENFTKYPLWQPSSQAPKSGTLTALLSFFSEGEYIRETAADMERLYALSQSVNPLFLRDMKGNIYMVRLSGPISQTVNYKTGVMEVTVSVPWVEVGDASDAKILSIGG